MEAIYDIEVTTGSMTHAGTFDNIFITLIGTQGVSERTKLDSYGRDFKTGMVRFFLSFYMNFNIFKSSNVLRKVLTEISHQFL